MLFLYFSRTNFPPNVTNLPTDLIMQVEQQVPDDELPVIGRYEISRAGGQQRLYQAPPGPQRVALCTQTPTDTIALHHLLQDGVHLLEGHTQGHIGGNSPPRD